MSFCPEPDYRYVRHRPTKRLILLDLYQRHFDVENGELVKKLLLTSPVDRRKFRGSGERGSPVRKVPSDFGA